MLTFYHPSHWSSEREGFHVKKCARPKESCAQCQGYRPLEAAPIAGLPIRKFILFEGQKTVFIRGSVAIGKTTLAKYLAAKFPQKYINVPATGLQHSDQDWTESTIEAVEQSTFKVIARDGLGFRNALKLAKDAGLTLFPWPNLCFALFKSDEEYRPKVLLFSASGEGSRSDNVTVATPLPNASELKEQLEEAGASLNVKSIKFLICFCGGHRGILMQAMQWVKIVQEAEVVRASRTSGQLLVRFAVVTAMENGVVLMEKFWTSYSGAVQSR